MNRSDLIAIRNANQDDFNFIMATWLKNTWYSRDVQTTLSKTAYFKGMQQQIYQILPNAYVRVACHKTTPEVIVGYGVFDSTGKAIWMYVKPHWRGIGISKLLKPNLSQKEEPCEKLAL